MKNADPVAKANRPSANIKEPTRSTRVQMLAIIW
jgi:hypothetical protein